MAKRDENDGLNDRQRLFVEEYLVDLNATQAAIRAGYSEKTAHSLGARLLRNVKVAAAIQARKDARTERTELSQDQVVREIARIGFSDIRRLIDPDTGSLVPPHLWDDDTAAAVSSIKIREEWDGRGEEREQVGQIIELKLWDKGAAHERLMKHLGGFDADNRQRNPFESLPSGVLEALVANLAAMGD